MENYLGRLIPSPYRSKKKSEKNKIIFFKKHALKIKLALDIKNLLDDFFEVYTDNNISNDVIALNGLLTSIRSYEDEERLRRSVSELNYSEHYELYIIISFLFRRHPELLPKKYNSAISSTLYKIQQIADLYLKAFIKARFLYAKIEVEEDRRIIEKAVEEYLELLS